MERSTRALLQLGLQTVQRRPELVDGRRYIPVPAKSVNADLKFLNLCHEFSGLLLLRGLYLLDQP